MATSVARGTHGVTTRCSHYTLRHGGAQTQTLWQIVMQRDPFLLMVQFWEESDILYIFLGVGFKHFLFSSLFEEDSHFD